MVGPLKLRAIAVIALLILAAVLVIVGCGSETGSAETSTTVPAVSTSSTAPLVTGSTAPVSMDALSTFKSKDPFKQQAVSGSSSSTTSTSNNTGSTTTTTPGGSTTTTSNPEGDGDGSALHNLKVLSIDEINNVAVCTFEVDDTVYEDKKAGDITSTSWGEIEVLQINQKQQTVVFLHGSETRTINVGQEFFK